MKLPLSPVRVVDLDEAERVYRRRQRWWWRAWHAVSVEVQLLHLRSVLWVLRRVEPAAARGVVELIAREVRRNG